MGYFGENESKVDIKVKANESDTGLRECQVGAFWAIKAHFTTDNTPAILSLPTGVGKTALMMLVALGIKATRVLVVVPSIVLRDQTYDKFVELDGLKTSEVIPKDLSGPNCKKLETSVVSAEKWKELKEFDVTIATPNVISSIYNSDIIDPPKGLFDLVFFDEAHHTKAPSWEALIETFGDAKQILLTATPFRNDKKRLPGKLIYNYPIKKAIESGIYSEVKYEAVNSDSTNRDKELIETAKQVFSEQREDYESVLLFVRTNEIEKAKRLEELYNKEGLNVKAVHSENTNTINESILDELKEHKIDGVIAVGMLGEGIDIPDLKIAVFHDPPKSFPFTIQLIGRVARTTGQKPNAFVIADPESLREKGVDEIVRRLYHDDKGWKELIPDLLSKVAGITLTNYNTGATDLLLGASIEDLEPYHSSTLYKVEETNFNFKTSIQFQSPIQGYRLPEFDGYEFLGLITEKESSPSWAKKTGLYIQNFDLHIYYYHKESGILFENTTAASIAEKIRGQILNSKVEKVGGEDLFKVLQSTGVVNYLSAGMANAIGPSPALPTYKILMGSEVQGAVNLSDERAFVRGHLFAKIDKNATRGISDAHGRVWSSKRSTIEQYLKWCSSLGTEIKKNKALQAPKNFNFFSPPKRIVRFATKPILAIIDPSVQNYDLTLNGHEKIDSIEIDSIKLEILKFNSGGRRRCLNLACKVNDLKSIGMKYDILENTWEYTYKNELTVKVDDGEYEEVDLNSFFERFQPWFYLKKGGIIKNGREFPLEKELKPLPVDKCNVDGLDWSDCDITKEAGIAEGGKKNIHDWLEDYLKETATDDTIIFKDHGSGEIADFIMFEPEKKLIQFFHCKSAPKKDNGEANIGASLAHIKDVVDQVIRSNGWVKSYRLFERIKGRNERPNASAFISGEDEFADLSTEFVPAKWGFTVNIVNPGLDFKKAKKDKNTNPVLITCYEWLKGTGTNFKIMGHV